MPEDVRNLIRPQSAVEFLLKDAEIVFKALVALSVVRRQFGLNLYQFVNYFNDG